MKLKKINELKRILFEVADTVSVLVLVGTNNNKLKAMDIMTYNRYVITTMLVLFQHCHCINPIIWLIFVVEAAKVLEHNNLCFTSL